ncbi:MAG: hypothetical protein IIA09_05350, partial [Proteobacteria bacterium]|nr:hypothetical protein [Pseudomonadota bacterium]
MKQICFSLLCEYSFIGAGVAAAQTIDRIPIIIDTDFVMPPHDDSMALMLALQSPEVEILGNRYPATVTAKPLYDPDGGRMRVLGRHGGQLGDELLELALGQGAGETVGRPAVLEGIDGG